MSNIITYKGKTVELKWTEGPDGTMMYVGPGWEECIMGYTVGEAFEDLKHTYEGYFGNE